MDPTVIRTDIITFSLGGWLGLGGAGALLSVLHRGPLPAPLQAAPCVAGGWVSNVVRRLLPETVRRGRYNIMVHRLLLMIIPSHWSVRGYFNKYCAGILPKLPRKLAAN